MKHLLYLIGWIWLLPVHIAGLFWFLPMLIKGNFENVWWDWNWWCLNWNLKDDSKFVKESMEGWWGFVIGNNIVYVNDDPLDAHYDYKHMIHEQQHVKQNYLFGMFFYPAYMLATAYIYLFQHGKHSYHDNPFEVNARNAAGQQVILTPEEWMNGPNDRFPWL